MKRRKWQQIGAVALGMVLVIHMGVDLASANSAQMHWRGVSSTGMIVADEDCPLEVKKEILTFDIQEFPENYYSEQEAFLAYSGKVTAEYTFYNPAAYSVTATLVFPFGKMPDYGYIYNWEAETEVLNADVEKYNILSGGETVEVKTRYTLSDPYEQFDLSQDMGKLLDGYVEDAFYELDTPVTKYTYKIEGISEEYLAATAALEWSEEKTNGKILLVDQSGGDLLDEKIRISTWADNEDTVTLYVIGEEQKRMPEWTFYENGACEKEIDGLMKQISVKTMSFKEFALLEYKETSGIPESDWYNAMVTALQKNEWEHGVFLWHQEGFDISRQLLRWHEYEITLEPGEELINTVVAPIYPAINLEYDPSIFSYTYLLSPAQTWAEFGDLEIIINTPFYITESNMEGFQKTEEGYSMTLEGLPKGELEFTLCSSENPEKPVRTIFHYFPYEIIVVLTGVIGVVILVTVLAIVIVRKRNKNRSEASNGKDL